MKLAIILTFFLLAGCNTTPITVTTEAVKKAPLVLPSVDEYSHRNLKWIILTPENAEKVFAELKKKGDSIAVFGLSTAGYEALSLNVSDIRKLIMQLNAQIDAYKKYYIVEIPNPPKTPETK